MGQPPLARNGCMGQWVTPWAGVLHRANGPNYSAKKLDKRFRLWYRLLMAECLPGREGPVGTIQRSNAMKEDLETIRKYIKDNPDYEIEVLDNTEIKYFALSFDPFGSGPCIQLNEDGTWLLEH